MSIIFNFKGIGSVKQKTKKQLERKFNTLNNKYVAIDKEYDRLVKDKTLTEEKEDLIIYQLNKIQDEMSKVSQELEERFG